MAGGLDVVLREAHATVRTDDDGRADDARDDLPVEVLLAPRAPRLEGRALGVGQEGEGEGLVGDERAELLDRVRRDADDLVAGGLQARERVAEVARLLRAGRRRGDRGGEP